MGKEFVKVTKAQAEAIEKWLKKHGDHYDEPKAEFVKTHMNRILWNEKFKALELLSNDILIKALYIGYEVEETPEEKVLAIYENAKMVASTNCRVATIEHYRGQIRATEQIIDILGIKIKGINE